MSRIFIDDYIQKIILLEKTVGIKTNYRIMEPFLLNSKDILEIQNAAKKIANFINLQDFTFIIATTRQKEKVAGHVELNPSSKEVFIEISENIMEFKDAVLATLAHEITHKYLHINNIYFKSPLVYPYENEIFTDIAAVFLGLGKLMLNGCECKNVRQEYVSINENRTVTETSKIGYLNRNQLAFVYHLICAMRRNSSTEYEQGLSVDSLQSLRECEKKYKNYFDIRFHNPNIRSILGDSLKANISAVQLYLADIDKNLLYIKSVCLNPIEDFLKKLHKRLNKLLIKLKKTREENEYDPNLKFLNAQQLDRKIMELSLEVTDYSSKVKKHQNRIEKLLSSIQNNSNLFLKPTPDMFTIVICRNDGTKLKLPKNQKRLIVECPNCKYRFMADTSIPSINKAISVKKDSLFKKIFKFLFRKSK